ncbi:MAG: sodium:proton antiporter [Lentimicrobium sp.]|nr:sodium:proton antiporter [Lentimicrobium sp.]
MTEYPIFVFTALLILLYGLFSKYFEKTVITAPMAFVTMGIIASFFQVEALREGIDAPLVKVLAEITLVLVLFNDASTINRNVLKTQRSIPLRLLLIGLPLTMLLGVFIAIPLFPGINTWSLVLMALILSPTDAALGQAVVTSKLVPEKIRQTINVESGLNDGIALPPILVCIAVLSSSGESGSGLTYWLIFTLKQFVYGPIIGGLVGWLGGWLVDKASGKGWMNSTFQQLSSLSLALMAFALAETVHGNGFIAAYFAGLMLGAQNKEVREKLHDFGEAESQALVLFIFLLMGMITIPLSYPFWDMQSLVYAVLSLTVIRMLPVAISLLGAKLSWKSVGFIGWFGPRGIASVLYMLLVIIELGMKGYERIISVIVLTVLLSIFLHGLSAVPLSKIFGKNE